MPQKIFQRHIANNFIISFSPIILSSLALITVNRTTVHLSSIKEH